MNILEIFANPVTDGIDDAITGSGLDNNNDIMGPVQLLALFFMSAIAIAAVVMIIIGAFSLQASQGDSGKVKKAKDTIMYGIIGVVVAISAFAIVNFVLGSVL